MSDITLKLKKLTRSALSKTTEDDVKLIFESCIDDWRVAMKERAMDGYNHFCIWKFNADEKVFILDNDNYDISKDDPEDKQLEPENRVIRTYSVGQFFNSKAFKEWILDSFPDYKLHYDSVDCENYCIRLSW